MTDSEVLQLLQEMDEHRRFISINDNYRRNRPHSGAICEIQTRIAAEYGRRRGRKLIPNGFNVEDLKAGRRGRCTKRLYSKPDFNEYAVDHRRFYKDVKSGRFIGVVCHNYPGNSPFAFAEENGLHIEEIVDFPHWYWPGNCYAYLITGSPAECQ